MTINDKAETIAQSALDSNQDSRLSEAGKCYAACLDLAKVCALLTSTSKDEREQGKTMVRRWKQAN